MIRVLNEAEKDRCEIMQRLRIVQISQSQIEEWFDRSLQLEGLLQNFYLERHRIKTVLQGTCASDSILQILAWQYIDDDRFRKAIDKNIRKSPEADTARFVAVLVQQGVSTEIYSWRTAMLSGMCFTISENNIKFFRCSSSPVDGLTQFVSLFPAVTSTSNCNCRIEKRFILLPIDVKHFKSNRGFKGLQKAIDKRISSGMILCKRCGQLHVENLVFGDIVFVAVGPPIKELQLVTDLKGIPLTIKLQGQLYDLRCFTDNMKENHGMANCLRRDGKWYQYDDNLKTAETLGKKTVPYLLMFRKRD